MLQDLTQILLRFNFQPPDKGKRLKPRGNAYSWETEGRHPLGNANKNTPGAFEAGTCIHPLLGIWHFPVPRSSLTLSLSSLLCWQQLEPFFSPFHSTLFVVRARSFQPVPLLLDNCSSSLLTNFCLSPSLSSCQNCLCDQILLLPTGILSPVGPRLCEMLLPVPSAALGHHICSQLVTFSPCPALPTALDLEHPRALSGPEVLCSFWFVILWCKNHVSTEVPPSGSSPCSPLPLPDPTNLGLTAGNDPELCTQGFISKPPTPK